MTSTIQTATGFLDSIQEQLSIDDKKTKNPDMNKPRPNPNSINNSTSKPRLHKMESSDTSRFPTLERIENTMPSKNSRITMESVIFNGDYVIKNGSKSIHSTKSHILKTKKKKQTKRFNLQHHYSTPIEIFAKNLSEAVLDVDDSHDNGYVYGNNNINLYPTAMSPTIESPLAAIGSNNEDYFSYNYSSQNKFRRPALRSAVSELSTRGIRLSHIDAINLRFEKNNSKSRQNYCYYKYSSSGEDGDEENLPLLRQDHTGIKHVGSRFRLWERVCSWAFVILFSSCLIMCLLFAFLAQPLEAIQVNTFSNVLGTQKQLIFNLHASARNFNAWKIPISHAEVSVFATSHYVPTTTITTDNCTTISAATISKQEYLGTIDRLEDPFIFDASTFFYFKTRTSHSISQVQIKNPGGTKKDSAGNERWSLLIRYPYDLTVRGVLKYQPFPFFSFTKTYSARICKMLQVDPLTGAIKDVPESESKAVCDVV